VVPVRLVVSTTPHLGLWEGGGGGGGRWGALAADGEGISSAAVDVIERGVGHRGVGHWAAAAAAAAERASPKEKEKADVKNV
jgi:hypothetical protein